MGYVLNEAAQRREVLDLYDMYTRRDEMQKDENNVQLGGLWDKLFEANPKAQKTFKALLRLRYPRASRADIDGMLTFVAPFEKQKADQDWRRTLRQVEALFGCMDADSSGGIDLIEFLNACEGVNGLPKESELRALFRSKDKDGNGVLDHNEFRALIEATGLTEHLDAIMERKREREASKWMVTRRTMDRVNTMDVS